MGTEYYVQCNHCGHKYFMKNGGGMDFYLLHCDTCGKEKRVSVEAMMREVLSGKSDGTVNERAEKMAGDCNNCGGLYKVEAPPRCPKCRSKEYTEIISEGSVTRSHYD